MLPLLPVSSLPSAAREVDTEVECAVQTQMLGIKSCLWAPFGPQKVGCDPGGAVVTNGKNGGKGAIRCSPF